MLERLDYMSGQVELIKQMRIKTKRLSKLYSKHVDTNQQFINKNFMEKKILQTTSNIA